MQNETLSWYVIRMVHGREILVRDRLVELGVEYFLPTQKSRGWRGRIIEKPLVNCLGFVRTSKREALDLIHTKGVRADFLLDHTTHRIMTVPDQEMNDFQKVFDLSVENVLTERPPELGARVRVIKGALTGVEGRVLSTHGQWYVVLDLMGVLFARTSVPRAWLEVIK